MSRETRLAAAFVGLADTLVADFDVVSLLQDLVEECVALLEVDAAGLLLADGRGGLRVLASTSEETRLLELFQLQVEQGPCLECISTGAPVLVPDVTADGGRWPKFAAEAGQRGFASVHAVPMRLRQQVLGALNLFHASPGPLSEQDLRAAQALADVATIGILQQRTIARGKVVAEQLQTALNSRVVIEQAKGVLAATGGIGMDAAFRQLRGYARNRNLPLTETARNVATGRLAAADVLADARHVDDGNHRR
jgi:GAF domain-containing protein